MRIMIAALLETLGALSVLVSVAAKIALMREEMDADCTRHDETRAVPASMMPSRPVRRLQRAARDDGKHAGINVRDARPGTQRRRRR